MRMEKVNIMIALRACRITLAAMFTAIFCASVYAEENCNEFASALQSFIRKPTDEGLYNIRYLTGEPKVIVCDCSVDVLVYHNAWLKKVLPNSQALVGITPNQFIKEQEGIMAGATKRLKACNSANLRLLIEAMKKQDFDPDVATSAKELEKQLGQ